MGASSCKDRNTVGASDLISAFQSGCVTAGAWTDIALSHSRSLGSVLESIKTKDPCRDFAGSLNDIDNFSKQVEELLDDGSFKDYRSAEEKITELTLALQQAEAGSSLATSLQEELVTTQVELAGLKADYRAWNESKQRDQYWLATESLAKYMQGILEKTSGLSSCLKSSPAVSVKLATNLLAIGGSFLSPIYGAGSYVVSQLVSFGLDEVRNSSIDNAIWDTYAAQMPTALTCGLEAMTEFYCTVNDTHDLMTAALGYEGPGSEPVYQGIDLLNRKLPELKTWLLKVRNGDSPRTVADADRKNVIWKQLLEIDTTSASMSALLFETKEKFAAAARDTRTRVIVKLLDSMISFTSPYCGPGCTRSGTSAFLGFADSPFKWSLWLLRGYSAADVPPGTDSIGTYIERLVGTDQVPDSIILSIEANWNALRKLVSNNVQIDFNREITSDPQAVLAEAHHARPGGISPREAIVYLSNYLANLAQRDKTTNPDLSALIQQTMAHLTAALAVIDNQGESAEQDPTLRLSRLVDQFWLTQGIYFFSDRITRFIQWDLETRLRNGDFPRDPGAILLAASGNIADRLAAAGIGEKTPGELDLDRARSTEQANIEIFLRYFGPSLGRAVQSLEDAARRAGEPAHGPNRPNGQILAQLCTLILATGSAEKSWPEDVSWEICSKATLDSIFPNPPPELNISVGALRPELEKMDMMKRTCVFHRYLRASRIHDFMRDGKPSMMPSLMDWVLQYR